MQKKRIKLALRKLLLHTNDNAVNIINKICT